MVQAAAGRAVPGQLQGDALILPARRLIRHNPRQGTDTRDDTAARRLLFGQVPGSIDIDPAWAGTRIETEHFDSPLLLSRQAGRRQLPACQPGRAGLRGSPRDASRRRRAGRRGERPRSSSPTSTTTGTAGPRRSRRTPSRSSRHRPGPSRTNFDDWLRDLILHEYSHIVQIDQVRGLPRALSYVFGRVMLPNALAPSWLDEGYAVYNETRFSNFGRLRSAEYDMVARVAADSGRLLPVDRCGGYELQRFPGGDAPYLLRGMAARQRGRARRQRLPGTGTTAAGQQACPSLRTCTRTAPSVPASTGSGTRPRSGSSTRRSARASASPRSRSPLCAE